MARKCKCKGCGEELTTDIAFKVTTNKKNMYYCNEAEYLKIKEVKEKKDHTMNYIFELLKYNNDQIMPPILIKKINALAETYDYSIIKETFAKNEDTLIYWWNLEDKFDSEYGRVCYIMRIIENNINDVYKSIKIKERQDRQLVASKIQTKMMDFDEETSKKKLKDISEFLD